MPKCNGGELFEFLASETEAALKDVKLFAAILFLWFLQLILVFMYKLVLKFMPAFTVFKHVFFCFTMFHLS